MARQSDGSAQEGLIPQRYPDVVGGREWLFEDQLANLAATRAELTHDVVTTFKP